MRYCPAILLVCCLNVASWCPAEPASQNSALLRRPAALALADDGRWLLVANRRSGTISIVDTLAPAVAAEHAAGKTLSDLALSPDGRRVLALDEADAALLVFEREGSKLTPHNRIPVSSYPVAMETSADGTRAYISSLWSRRLTIVDVPQAKVVHTLSLPFAPRELIRVAEGRKLIVADAFAGRLAIVDANTGNLDAVRQLPAHNIRGLALSPNGRKLLVAHQILNDLAETTHNDVHWGVLMSNVVRWLSLDRVLDPAADILADSHVHLAGDSNTPGADPSGMAMTPGGTAIVALAGGNELGLVQEDDYSLYRVPLGRRPTAVVATSDGRRAYVANTFDDSISLVDVDPARVEPARVERTLRLGEMPRLTLVDKGELLFYDASLSSDGWFSCHSCHTDGHTNGLLNDNLGDNSFGAAKRVLSLLGVAESAPWAWNGSVKSLETQIHKSIRTTMQGREPSGEQIEALAAYLKSLPPPPSLAEARGDADQAAIARGQKVFDRLQCVECHAPPAYTDSSVYDVGLADRLGNRTFNPPSLLGVSQRDRYFHDNRAENLEEVFGRFQHKVPGDLARQELDDLLWFLQSL